MLEWFSSLLAAKPILVGLHLGFAILGIDLTLWLWGELVARSMKERRIRLVAGGAAISYFVSWFFGGYYYVKFYGSLVKPAIKSGIAPWAHAIFMETKEHIFLFIPPLALTLLFLSFLAFPAIEAYGFRRPFKRLAMLTAALGLLIGAMGFIISAAARWAS